MWRGGIRIVWLAVGFLAISLWLVGSVFYFRVPQLAEAAVVSIAGTVYNSDETTVNTSGPTVRVKVNGGGTYSATASVVNGTFSVGSVTVNAGDSIVVYLDTGGGIHGATYSRATGSNMTGIDVYRETISTRCDNSACSLTNTDLDYWDKGNDSDIHATVTGGVLTVDSDWKLLVKADTYAPGGNVTAPGISIKGTFTPATYTITLNGGGTNTTCTTAVTVMTPLCISGGTFTAGSSHVKITGDGAAVTATTYNQLTIGGGTTLARAGNITGNSGENYFYTAVADPVNDYAYFGTFTAPGKIVKVRLSDMSRVAVLTLNSGENYPIYTAAIDTTNGFAYFGTDDATGEVVKIQLSDFTRVGALNFSAGEATPYSATIDVSGGYAYFGTNDSPGKIVKVRLSDFTRIGALTLNSGENSLRSAVVDSAGGYAYFGADVSPLKIVKVQLSDFTRTGVITMNVGEAGSRGAQIDVAAGFAYFTDLSTPTKILKIQLSDFTRNAVLALNTGEATNAFMSGIDTKRGFMYLATNQSPLQVVKVQLSDFTRVTAVAASSGENTGLSMAFDPIRGNIGVGTFATPSKVIKFTSISNQTLATATSQTITTNSSITIDGYANADTYDPVINDAGGLTINTVGYYLASSASTLSVGGAYANSGRFVHQNGTVALNGSASQAISGATTGDDKFYNLTISNSSGADDPGCGTSFTAGVDFAGSVTVANNYTITTASVRVEYESGQTYTFNNINWNGQATGTRIFFRNSNLSSGTWLLNVSGTQTAVSYVNVARSDASGGNQIVANNGTNTDCSNNTNWLLGLNLSGTVHSTDETTAVTTGPTVRAKVNGAGSYSATASVSDGTYTISGISMSANDAVTVYLDTGGGISAATFTLATGANMTSINLYRDRAAVRCDNTCSLTNTHINNWDKDDDSDIHASVSGGNLTVDNDWKLLVVNNTFLPGGSITTAAGGGNAYSGDVEIKSGAVLSMGGSALSIGGSYSNSGTFTSASNTTTFTATGTGKTIGGTLTGSSSFYNLTFNGSGGGWTISADAAATADLTITNGTLTAPSGTLSIGGSYSNSGTLTHNSGMVTFTSTSTGQTLSGTMTSTSAFNDLTFNGSGGGWTLSASATVSDDFLISAGTVVAPSALIVNGDFTNSGTFTHNSGTVTLAGAAKQTLSGTLTTTSSFNNLIITNNSGTADPGCGTSFTPSVDFTVAATVAGTLTAITASTKIEFESGATYTVDSMTLNGQDAGTKIQLRNSNLSSGTWTLVLNGTESVSYVDVARSNATGGSFVYAGNGTNTDCTNNTNWVFSAPDTPTSLTQTKTNDTSLAVGDWTNETSVKFNSTASDAFNTSDLQLCIEKDLLGVSFSNTEDSCGSAGSYAGTPISLTHTISSLADASEYHWQVRTKNQYGGYSAWQAFGSNAESARDFGTDTTAPTTGSVNDGSAGDVDFNDGSLTVLEANWSGFNADASGILRYEYSIGTSAGDTSIKTWTSNTTNTSVSSTGLILHTGQRYYVNVRLLDNAGNTSNVVSSDGQDVLPQISFSLSGSTVSFSGLASSNNRQDTKTITTTTSTNAYGGYVVRAYKSGLLTNGVTTIPDFSAGSYSTPASWGSGFCTGTSCGFGYTSSDTTIQGSNLFSSGTLYAPFSSIAPGEIVADHTTAITGTTGTLSNDQHTVTLKVAVDALQPALNYTTTLYFLVTGTF